MNASFDSSDSIVGPGGRLLSSPYDDGMALPHAFTFNALLEGGYHTYFHGPSDEAIRFQRSYALEMLRDGFMYGLIQERIYAVSSLKWSLKIPDEKNPLQLAVRDHLKKAIEQMFGWSNLVKWLAWSSWYGRYGVQCRWGWEMFEGKRTLMLQDMEPVNGDKLVYKFTGVPVVHVGIAHQLPNAKYIPTSDGWGLVLQGTWRDKFIIHTWQGGTDEDYWNPEAADAIHGRGLRSLSFWDWWLMTEWTARTSDFMDRVGMGITVWKFAAGNADSEAAVRKAMKQQSGRVNIALPVFTNATGQSSEGVERIEVPVAGADLLQKIIEPRKDNIRRLIVGQDGSSSKSKSGGGIGNEADTEFLQQTKGQITKDDALGIAETLTGRRGYPGLLSIMQDATFPECAPGQPNGFRVRLNFEVEDTRSKDKLEAGKTIVELGVPVKADELRETAGYSKPGDGDELAKAPEKAPAGMGGLPGQPGQPSGNSAQQPQPEEFADAPDQLQRNGWTVAQYAAAHAPAGGATINGKFFKGGEFIPGEDLQNASTTERQALRSKGGAKWAEHPLAQPVPQPQGASQPVAAAKQHANSKPPWAMTSEEFAKSGIKTFKTSQGSLYAFANGQSIRVKTPHEGHEATDVGLKRGSEVTHFVDAEDAKKIGWWQSASGSGKRIHVTDNGYLLLTSTNPLSGKPGLDEKIKIASKEPVAGLCPVELWDKSSQGPNVYRGNHPGNAITAMNIPDAHATFVNAAKAAGKQVASYERAGWASIAEYAAHDVSGEARDPAGKWTIDGAVEPTATAEPYEPGAGEGVLYDTKNGCGGGRGVANEALRAKLTPYFERVHGAGHVQAGFPSEEDDAEMNEIALLGRDILRSQLPQASGLIGYTFNVPDGLGDYDQRVQLEGDRGTALMIARIYTSKGNYLALGGPNAKGDKLIRIPENASRARIAYLIHRIAGLKAPERLRAEFGKRNETQQLHRFVQPTQYAGDSGDYIQDAPPPKGTGEMGHWRTVSGAPMFITSSGIVSKGPPGSVNHRVIDLNAAGKPKADSLPVGEHKKAHEVTRGEFEGEHVTEAAAHLMATDPAYQGKAKAAIAAARQALGGEHGKQVEKALKANQPVPQHVLEGHERRKQLLISQHKQRQEQAARLAKIKADKVAAGELPADPLESLDKLAGAPAPPPQPSAAPQPAAAKAASKPGSADAWLAANVGKPTPAAKPKMDAHAKLVGDLVAGLSDKPGALVPLGKIRAGLAAQGIRNRDQQDAIIDKARGETVTGSGLEGRHGITQEETDNALHVGGERIGYLSTKAPESLLPPKAAVAAKAPALDPANVPVFAAAVHQAARAVKAAVGEAINNGSLPEWDAHKPLIADVYEAMKPQLGNLTLEGFKEALLKAHVGGAVELSRNDLPHLTHHTTAGQGPARSQRSAILHNGGEYNLLNSNSAAARQAKTPIQFAKEHEDGWKTLKTGTHVYVVNGVVKLGPSALTNRRMDSLWKDQPVSVAEAKEEKAHQRQQREGRATVPEGVNAEHLHGLAEQILQHDGERVAEQKDMLQRARKYLGSFGGAGKTIALIANRGGDWTGIEGFDLAAEEAARDYPHLFTDGEAPEDKLFELLTAGNPEPMSEEDAYAQALETLREYGEKETVASAVEETLTAGGFPGSGGVAPSPDEFVPFLKETPNGRPQAAEVPPPASPQPGGTTPAPQTTPEGDAGAKAAVGASKDAAGIGPGDAGVPFWQRLVKASEARQTVNAAQSWRGEQQAQERPKQASLSG